MKLNLLLDNPGDCRSGFINVDPCAPDGDEFGRVRGEIWRLDAIADAGEVAEIVALDLLDNCQAMEVDDVLVGWLSRLKHGGMLTLSVVDLREVSRSVLNGNISIMDANELLFGKQERPWQFKKSVFTLSQLVEVLGNLGYRIIAQRVQNYRAVITVERP